MANMLLQNQMNNASDGIGNMIGKLKSAGPSNMLLDQMYKNNPAFKNFADSMRGKTPEQAFREHGLDFSQFRNMKW